MRFETLSVLMGMLNTMTDNNLPANYIKKEEAYVKGLMIEQQLQKKNYTELHRGTTELHRVKENFS
ncbi:MAG: hypothetical protein AAB347_00775 [Bacteroidota bacterium]